MTYVTDQTSAELRMHMRSLKKMPGWHEPLADRLWREVQEQHAEIERLREAIRHLTKMPGGHFREPIDNEDVAATVRDVWSLQRPEQDDD